MFYQTRLGTVITPHSFTELFVLDVSLPRASACRSRRKEGRQEYMNDTAFVMLDPRFSK